MEKVVKMDRDMTKVRGEITKELLNILKIGGQAEFLGFTDVKNVKCCFIHHLMMYL